MKVVFLLLSFFISTCISAQVTDLKTIDLDEDYTWRNSTLAERDHFYFKFPHIRHSNYKIHFRISLTGQTIDFFSNDNEYFEGVLTNKITEYTSVKTEWGEGSEANNFVFQKIKIDSDLSTALAKKIIASGQFEVPTDSLLTDWNRRYLHCGSIHAEFKINEIYNNQSFHCPWSQPDGTSYVDVILSNYQLLKKELDLKTSYELFESQLKGGKTYSKDGYIMIYVMSERQVKVRNKDKPRRDYLASLKDTIDNYLKAELLKLEIEREDFSCYKDYRLTFNKKGKMKNIKLFAFEKPKIADGFSFYFKEKKGIRKCKRAIRRAFREIDLSAFHLKYKVHRTVTFGSKEQFILKDKMIY